MTSVASKHESFFSPEVLTDPKIPYDERRQLLLEGSRAYLAHHRDLIQKKHRSGVDGRLVVGSLTSMTDTLMRNLYRSVLADVPMRERGACSLIAIGGYGRGELNHLMFYYSGKDRLFTERLSERMLYLLWDLGLDIGYSVRTEKDCLEMMGKDITARTALLDSRLLVGDEELYRQYDHNVYQAVLSLNSRAFLSEKREEHVRRLQRYGSSVYLLEPNIKEGEGGLRDLHTALWVARVKYKARSLRDLIIKGVMNEQEGTAFENALDYLWRIRNELHFLSGRKNDQMFFDLQEKIAQFMGYVDHRKGLAVEQFMQDFYNQATATEYIASNILTKSLQLTDPGSKILGYFTRREVADGFYILHGELRVTREDIFEKDPALIMKAFLLSQRQGVDLSLPLQELIRNNRQRINDRVRRLRRMNEDFMQILRNPHGLFDTLKAMHHLQVLNQFIPEFGRIFCKVQHDAYHIYTVDIHSLFAVEEIAKLWLGTYREQDPLVTKVANDIEKRELLLLAVLLHDIGKGEGKDHCNKGADMIPTLARRMGLNKEDSARLEFLIRHHLEMSHIAQRRDLHDDKLIIQFAKSMGMSENLNMLYLLTFADLRAVGPDVWSDWKGFLLKELYEKTYQVLERGNFLQEQRSQKVRNRKRKVVGLLEDEFGKRMVQDALKEMYTRYLLSNRSAAIADHLRLIFSRKNEPLVTKIEHEPQGKYSQITISTVDIPGLFSKITGVLAANGINILGAQINTLNNGVALDVLQVSSVSGDMVNNEAKWSRVKEDLTTVIQGRVRVDELMLKRQRSGMLPSRPRPKFPNRVDIDNEVSEDYTVVDIYTQDQVGVLYQITKTLKELGLYIGVAKISTKVDQVADTFYVQDIFGQKVVAREKLEELQSRLLAGLAELSPVDK
ncbi:MAG: [protein-PII] uridylyltransferase [Desulfuromonadaceae bacterium]